MNATDKLAQTCRTAMAILTAFVILAVLSVILTGCKTTYKIDKKPDGSISIIVESYREFDKPKVIYDRNGEVVGFQFNAEKASTAVSPIEEAIADGIRAGTFILGPPGVQP